MPVSKEPVLQSLFLLLRESGGGGAHLGFPSTPLDFLSLLRVLPPSLPPAAKSDSFPTRSPFSISTSRRFCHNRAMQMANQAVRHGNMSSTSNQG